MQSTFFADGAVKPTEAIIAPTAAINALPTSGSAAGAQSTKPTQPTTVVEKPQATGSARYNNNSGVLSSGSTLTEPENNQDQQPVDKDDEQNAAQQNASDSWEVLGVSMKKLYWILSGAGVLMLLAVLIKYLKK